MSIQFSEMEQSIIKNMMLQKSHKEISSMLECNVEDINEFVKREVSNTGLISWQMKLDEKKPAKKVKTSKPQTPGKPEKNCIKELPKSTKIEIENRRRDEVKRKIKMEAFAKAREIENEKKYKRRPPNYKTIQVDYTKLVTIRIDKQTTIYSRPGEEDATRKRFLKNYIQVGRIISAAVLEKLLKKREI